VLAVNYQKPVARYYGISRHGMDDLRQFPKLSQTTV
jgi:hypothetical protein